MRRMLVLGPLLIGLIGCTTSQATRPYREPPPANVQATRVDYVDSEAFDALFESALLNQDPVIIVHTDTSKPNWSARLNAWIAAWNMGGKVQANGEGRKVRLQVWREKKMTPVDAVVGDWTQGQERLRSDP